MSKHLLVLNVHYAPQSFGGATVVAEALNKSLVQDHGWRVTVITYSGLSPAALPHPFGRRHIHQPAHRKALQGRVPERQCGPSC